MGALHQVEQAKGASAILRDGVERLRTGKFTEAMELLDRARALDPNNLSIQFNLGAALQGAGRHAEALECFKPLQTMLPNDPAPAVGAAMSLLALGRADAALAAAEEARRRAPYLPQTLFMYGQTMLALNHAREAEEAFTAVLQKAPAWADAWVQCGVARYRQGAVEGAKEAMREALCHAPGHRAAEANLKALMRRSGKTKVADGSGADIRTDFEAVQQSLEDAAVLSAWKPSNPEVSLGLAVEFLRKKPAFARLPFGEWSQVLVGQINRGHFCFIMDQKRRVHGFFGWALTPQYLAEEWIEGRSGLRDEECRAGDCVIFNAWAANSPRVHRFMVDTARRALQGKRMIYYKRHYSDGRSRLVRLSATNFISNHIARTAAPATIRGGSP